MLPGQATHKPHQPHAQLRGSSSLGRGAVDGIDQLIERRDR